MTPRLECRGVRPAGVDWPAGFVVGFALGPGEVVVIRGKSGSGKTALLRVLAGLDTPVAGEVFWNGRPTWSLPRADARPGLLTTGLRLQPELTVRDSLSLAAVLAGAVPEFAERHKNAVLAAVGLDEAGESNTGALSPVDRERLALARELAVYPETVLLDDPYPTPALRGPMNDTIRKIRSDLGTAVIYACTQPDEIAEATREVIVLPSPRPAETASSRTSPARPKAVAPPPAWLAVDARWLAPRAEVPWGAAWPDALRQARHAVIALRDAQSPAAGTPTPGTISGASLPVTVSLEIRPHRRLATFVRVGPGRAAVKKAGWSPDDRRAVLFDLSGMTAPPYQGTIDPEVDLIVALWTGPRDNEPLRDLAERASVLGGIPVVPTLRLGHDSCGRTEAATCPGGTEAAMVPYLYICARGPSPAAIWEALEKGSVVLALPATARGAGTGTGASSSSPDLCGPPPLVLQVHAARRAALAALAAATAATDATAAAPGPSHGAHVLAAHWAFHAGNFTLASSLLSPGRKGG